MNNGAQVIIALALAGFGGTSVVMLVSAFARRIAGPKNAGTRELRDLRAEVEQLHVEQDEMRTRLAQLDELHNRLDFAERMIAQGKDKTALPGGR